MRISLCIGVAWLAGCRPLDPRDRLPELAADARDGTSVPAAADEPVPATPRFARLTHLQWENAVRDLLSLPGPTGQSEGFIGDALAEGFENDAATLQVAPELWEAYQRAAEAVAASVIADRALYEQVVGGDPAPGADAQRDRWIRDLGLRAHRRPLTEVEQDAYRALFDRGPELVGSGDDFADGVLLVITAVLQAPAFLYRVEESDRPDRSGRIPLSSWELASKLSFALWNTLPDDRLFAAAAADRLRTDAELRAEAERMLDDPRAHETVADLHRQLLRLDNYDNIVKDPALYPEFGPTTPTSMAAEARAFVDDVVFSDGGVHRLLTSSRTFVNEDLARIYGIGGVSGTALVPVELDPAERAGLLTLSGFLALEADAFVHSPIRRGVLVNDDLLCATLPSPPDAVPPLPPPEGDLTTRERVDRHTGVGTCGEGCHATLINPIGFAYERYDALGRYRTEENGQPVDSSADYPFADGPRGYRDAVELAGLLGDAPEVHACYAGHWLGYLQGRHPVEADAATLARIGRLSREEDLPIREVIVQLVLSNGFRYRSPEVEP